MSGIQTSHYSPSMGNIATTAPIVSDHGAGLANADRIPLTGIANTRASALAHPWSAGVARAVPMLQSMGKAFGNDFLGTSPEPDASAGTSFGPYLPGAVGADSVNVLAALLAAPTSGAGRGGQPVLSASAVETLHICASAENVNPRIVSVDSSSHPVRMPYGRSERAQICRGIVCGSLLGTGGRNGTVPFDTGRDDVTTVVADTARRWTGHPALAGKKEWSRACDELESPATFIEKVCDRLHQGSRVLPTRASTEWMLRVGYADGLPMHQAMVRSDLPPAVALGSDDWVKLTLGIEQLGERHWEMRHSEVMDAAALPATNTKSFTALATSMSSKPPHIATQRLRNQLTLRGLPTAPAEGTTDASAQQ
ncbi:hypothetical protein PCO31111_01550 [Pandoraea communis]|uniref:Uncharacterized protein n=1 Tax=Pandoraea communis TaxID=2508297 RepID=A0A5E4TUA3_9BURK|nr:hypothetical protein [Pandoraea communis]VVD89529.1 hypothetical protein PCO31111_01550 [Pandoraea communis]